MEKNELKKYIFVALFVITLILAYSIIKPFIIPIILSFILAYLIRPLEKKLNKTMPKKVSAALAVFVALVIILLPLAAITTGIVNQATHIIGSQEFKSILTEISNSQLFQKLNIDLKTLANKTLEFIASSFGKIAVSVAEALIGLFVTILCAYYLLVDWEKITFKAKKYIPFKNKEKVSNEISDITKSLIYGTLFIALIEFIVMALGLWLASINSFFLLAAIAAISAFIPAIGPGLVWIPLLVYQAFQGEYISAAIILVTGLIISIYLDTLLRVKIAGEKTKIHPFVVLIGIFGGVAVFGLAGLVVGPLILAYAIELLKEFWENE